MTNGYTHYCSLHNGDRFAMHIAPNIIRTATRINSALACTDSGEYVTMIEHDEVKRLGRLAGGSTQETSHVTVT